MSFTDGPRAHKCFGWFDGLVGGWQQRRQNKGRRRKRAEHLERKERAERHERLEDYGPDGRRWHKHFRHQPEEWYGVE